MLRALFNRGTSLRNAATRSLRGTAARFRSPLSAKAVGFGTSVVTVAGMGFTISSFRGEAVAEAKGEQEQVKDLKHYQEFHKELMEKYENLDILPLTAQGLALHTIIRDRVTARDDFVFYSNRIIRLLIEQALSKLPFAPSVVMTPTAVPFYGLDFRERVVGVSIMRAGDSMVAGLRSVAKGVRIGKVLIQRDEEDPEKRAHLSYVKFPGDIARRHVLLLDPMLATGGSAKLAIKELKKQGVAEERITFVNVVTTPEGIDGLFQAYPKIKVVTSFVDPGMNDMKYILPGLGDFGDRYFGTEEDQHGRRTFTYH
mmetsp:Transcript_35255/g.49370  ORF Transcript_35255/g.49370 Transcript_35255/m.49370 type:complete len:313 (-) Transcript_35255:99-1037(-)|eukprot:jgi/Bigna1/87020/estExt_fgenesh1_pg.C_160040